MAEVVGLVAAGGQFIEESIKIIKIAKAARDKYRDAPKEIENWQQQVESLKGLVESIPPSLRDAKEIVSTVDRCKAISNSLLHTLDAIQFSESDSFRHKTWRAVVSVLKEGEIRSSFSELEQLKSSLSLHIAVSNLNNGCETTHTTTLLEDLLSSLNSGSGSGSDEERCLRALFITDAQSDRDGLITTKGHRTPGTFEWIPQTRQYQDWNTSEKGLLWISGAPGKGKTIISIFLSELLEVTKSTVIYFFCDNKAASRNSAVNILRGLMSQLIQQHPELLSCLLYTWKVQQDTLFKSFETLWRIFHQMLEALKGEEVCCVLDALDECDEQSLTSLLRKITDSYNNPSGLPLKLVIASREEPKALPQALARYPRITLEHINKDVRLYISQKVCNLASIKMIHGSPLHHRIMKAFREGAEGTFLWVSYMAHDLETKSLSEIELALSQLPRGLDEIYERIMCQIRVENRDKIAEMLMWIMFTKCPQGIFDLCEAIRVQACATLSREEVCFDYIRSCGYLLQIQVLDKRSRTWVAYLPQDGTPCVLSQLRTTFLHQSAKDFLLRMDEKHLSLPIIARSNEAHLRILDRLLEILEVQLCDGKKPDLVSGPRIPLLSYSILFLTDHMSQLGEEWERLLPKHEAFLAKVSKVRDAFSSLIPCHSVGQDIPLLHFACNLGLYWLAKICLQTKDIWSLLGYHRKLNQRWGLREEAPLHLAVQDRSSDIVRLLLSCGANIESENGMRQTPLHLAVQDGSSDMVQLLLSHGADVTSKDLSQKTTLHCAIVSSTVEVYKLLSGSKRSNKIYQEEAKPYIKSNNEWGTLQVSLLHVAAENGWDNLCQELIQHHNYGIDWEVCFYKRPIHFALENGHLNLAKRAVKEWGACLAPEIQLLRAIFDCERGPKAGRIDLNPLDRDRLEAVFLEEC